MYFYTKHVKSPTQMERDAVCRGQFHGWLKERVGSHIIRRCHIHHCEQTGIVGRMGAVFSTIEDCHIHHVCNSQQLGGAETAGIKLHAAIDVTIRREVSPSPMAFTAGNTVEIVFPTPVGASKNSFFLRSIVLYTPAARSFCPSR